VRSPLSSHVAVEEPTSRLFVQQPDPRIGRHFKGQLADTPTLRAKPQRHGFILNQALPGRVGSSLIYEKRTMAIDVFRRRP